MDISQICKICLSMNVQMFNITNTSLQEMYEKLTSLPFSKLTGSAETVCYQCAARLRSCRRLQQTAARAAEVLTLLLSGDSMVEESLRHFQEHISSGKLVVNVLESIDISGNTDDVKSEPEDIKIEPAREGKGIEDVQNSDGECNEPADTAPPSDSDDDLPLKTISTRGRGGGARQTARKRRKKTEAVLDAVELTLSWEQQREELAARAQSANYLNSPYKCRLCFRGFVDPEAHRNHALRHSEAHGALECPVCRLRYPGARQLRAHAAAAHERRYACNRCPHRAHTKNQALEHEKWHNGHTYPCRLCGETFSKPTTYLTHLRKAHASEHVCARCGHSFVGRHGLLMHASKAHRAPDPEPNPEESPDVRSCKECEILFASREAWTRHMLVSVKHEPWTEDGACVVCGEAVAGELRREHERAHVRALRPAPAPAPASAPLALLTCDQCESRFASAARLRAHVRRVHLGLKYDKNVICELCGKKCTSEATLRYHQRRHTGLRPYRCATCDARFSDSNQLRIHARRHSGERPYACAACPKRFTQKPALTRHYRVHTGAKPYECQLCSKSFSQSNSVKLHVNTVHLRLGARRRQDKPRPAEPAVLQPGVSVR